MTELEFCDALIRYVQQSGVAAIGARGELPEHWVYSSEAGEFSNAIPNSSVGPIGGFCDTERIAPKAWSPFARQFYSPHADLIDRLYQECQIASVRSWLGRSGGRNETFVTRDFWSHQSQRENYARLLGDLRDCGLLYRSARAYHDDANAVGILIDGDVVDIPGSYEVLLHVWRSVFVWGDRPANMELPHVSSRYGRRKPVLFMVGTTAPVDDERMRRFLDAALHPRSSRARYQAVTYVLSEHDGERFVPRHVDSFFALVLGCYEGAPYGIVRDHGHPHLVPLSDLTVEERKNLDTSQANWRLNGHRITALHPALAEFLAATP